MIIKITTIIINIKNKSIIKKNLPFLQLDAKVEQKPQLISIHQPLRLPSSPDEQVQVGSPEEKSENTGDDCDDEDEDEDISRHRCLQCDKHFGDYDE